MRRAKHFNNGPTTMPFTRHHTGMQQWERTQSILTSNFGVNSQEKK